MVDVVGPQEDARPVAQKGWLTEDDKHVLVVSIAANLVTVLAVGGGLALVHYVRGLPVAQHHHAVTDLMLITGGVAVVYGLIAVVCRARARHNQRYRPLYLAARIYVAVPLFVLVLALIGVASGFK
jgi:hypothetical protein